MCRSTGRQIYLVRIIWAHVLGESYLVTTTLLQRRSPGTMVSEHHISSSNPGRNETWYMFPCRNINTLLHILRILFSVLRYSHLRLNEKPLYKATTLSVENGKWTEAAVLAALLSKKKLLINYEWIAEQQVFGVRSEQSLVETKPQTMLKQSVGVVCLQLCTSHVFCITLWPFCMLCSACVSSFWAHLATLCP